MGMNSSDKGINEIRATMKMVVSCETLFVLFLFAGRYKDHPLLANLPIDLTLALFLLSFFAVIWVLLTQRRLRVQKLLVAPLLAMTAFVGFAVSSLMWTPGWGYATIKTLDIATILPFCFIVPALIIGQEERRVRRFMAMVVIVSTAMAIHTTYLFIFPSGGQSFWAALEGEYIGVGRSLGLGAIVLIGIALFGKGNLVRLGALLGASFHVFVIGIIGSRGPAMAVIMSLGVLAVPLLLGAVRRVLHGKAEVQRRFLVSGLLVLMTGGGIAILGQRYSGAAHTLRRATSLVEGQLSTGVEKRLRWYGEAWQISGQHPVVGGGVGSFPVESGKGDERGYPHNIILEILTEFGVIGVVLFGILVGVSIKEVIVSDRSDVNAWRMILLMFIVNVLVNAAVSGSLSDNRWIFVALGFAAAYPIVANERERLLFVLPQESR